MVPIAHTVQDYATPPGAFNPSVVTTRDGKRKIFYRLHEMIYCADLDGMTPRNPREVIGGQDPRAFRLGSSHYCSYVTRGDKTPSGWWCQQNLMSVSEDGDFFHNIKLDYHDNLKLGLNKNWGFFEHRGRIAWVYKIRPFVVAWLDGDLHVSEKDLRWDDECWGTPCGGSLPVYHEGEWWSFFHSSFYVLPRGATSWLRIYNVGAFAFTVEKGITRWTDRPILRGRPEPTNQPVWPGYTPICIFPMTAEIRDGVWNIAAGINDCRCVNITIKHSDLHARLQPVG